MAKATKNENQLYKVATGVICSTGHTRDMVVTTADLNDDHERLLSMGAIVAVDSPDQAVPPQADKPGPPPAVGPAPKDAPSA